MHLIYESADEAFSFRSMRVALTTASGFGRESACWEQAAGEPSPNLKSHLSGMNIIEGWAGITYYLKSGLTAANIAGAPFGAGAIAQVGGGAAPGGSPAGAGGLIPQWPPPTPHISMAESGLTNTATPREMSRLKTGVTSFV